MGSMQGRSQGHTRRLLPQIPPSWRLLSSRAGPWGSHPSRPKVSALISTVFIVGIDGEVEHCFVLCLVAPDPTKLKAAQQQGRAMGLPSIKAKGVCPDDDFASDNTVDHEFARWCVH